MNICHLSPLFSLLGKKWVTHLLATFSDEKEHSFGDIKRAFPSVTSATLSARLKDLQAFDLLEKTAEGKYIPTTKLIYLGKVIGDIDFDSFST